MKYRLALVGGLWAACLWNAQSAITVTGVADRQTYVDRATFTVAVESGYDYFAVLNTSEVPVGVPVSVPGPDYYNLDVYRTNRVTHVVESLRVRFVVRSSERGSTENGLPPWTPYPPIPSAPEEFAGAHLRLITPAQFPMGYPIPLVAWVENDAGHAVRVHGVLEAQGHPSIRIVRGVGSGFLASDHPAGSVNYQPSVGGLSAAKTIIIEPQTTWTSVSGTLSGTRTWPAGARVDVAGNLTIPAGSTLTIEAGVVVRLAPAVDITLDGRLIINGTTDQPVVFMPRTPGQPWGGFLLSSGTGQVEGTGVIFTGSGADPNWFGSGGHPGSHRKEQALFFCSGSPRITLSDSAAIYLAGQLGHAVNGGTFTFSRFLMQHTTTGGEYTGASFHVNDSAFIECPDETPDFVDGDNDALYIVSGTHGFTNTLFGWTKDDGVDSGGSGAGVLHFQNCWFESILHEGNSLSGTGKDVQHHQSVFVNCGQGLEAGYNGPHGWLDRSLAVGNLVGGRFGDNYDWSYSGFLRATGSILIHNYRDVWGVNFEDWTYRTSAMDIQGNYLTTANTNHPNNTVWNPAVHASLLAPFLTIPADAPVGIGFAVRNAQASLDQMSNGLVVALSSFTVHPVTVRYRAQSDSGVLLASGTLTFEPGEIRKKLELPAVDPAAHSVVRVTLTDPQQGRLTGLRSFYFFGRGGGTTGPVTFISRGAVWKYLDTGMDAGTAWRELAYDDTAWKSGPAELGYGDGDEATVVSYGPDPNNKYITTYFRRSFMVEDPDAYGSLSFWLKSDDGAVAYLNGVEFFRTPNMPTGTVTYRTTTTSSRDTTDTGAVSPALLRAGLNVLAVEVHQRSGNSSDISFDFELTAFPLPRVNVLNFGDELLLQWSDPAFELESADRVTGPWQTVPQPSPVAVQPVGPQKFYRLHRR